MKALVIAAGIMFLISSNANADELTTHCAVASQIARDQGVSRGNMSISVARALSPSRGQCVASDGRNSFQITFDAVCAESFERRCTRLVSAVNTITGEIAYVDSGLVKSPGKLSSALPASDRELCERAVELARTKYHLKIPASLKFAWMMHVYPDRTCMMNGDGHQWRLGIIAKCEQTKCVALNTVFDADSNKLLLNRHLH